MAFVRINPVYKELLAHEKLTEATQFLALPGVIICGHPDRHVLRVELGNAREEVTLFLKREHRVSWRQRLVNAWAGFGFSSQSCREARTLGELREAGVGCPDWIAAGEDDSGRAFLLVRGLTGTLDLAHFLRASIFVPPGWRRTFARYLGENLAHMHEAGFPHPDLSVKHVLVDPHDNSIHFLDWQRSRRRSLLPWHRRWRDLAMLHATLGNDLANERERLVCLRAYLRASLGRRPPGVFRIRAIRWIGCYASHFLRQRKVRELRHATLPVGSQQLVWLDGEGLCVTPEFLADLRNQVPRWLVEPDRRQPLNVPTRRRVRVPGASAAFLVRRRTASSWDWLRSCLGAQRPTSPELAQAGLLFRLQRQGIVTPRLLAVGQRQRRLGHMDSFLLVEPLAEAVSLVDWLKDRSGREIGGIQRRERWQMTRRLGELLRELHDADCVLGRPPRWSGGWRLQVHAPEGQAPQLVLGGVEDIVPCRRPSVWRISADLVAVSQFIPDSLFSRTDALRLGLAYLGAHRLTPAAKKFLRRVLRPRPSAVAIPPKRRAGDFVSHHMGRMSRLMVGLFGRLLPQGAR